MRTAKGLLALTSFAVLQGAGVFAILIVTVAIAVSTGSVLTAGASAGLVFYIGWFGLTAIAGALSLAMLRFGLRVFPSNTSGRRRTGVIVFLAILLAAALTAGFFLSQELRSESHPEAATKDPFQDDVREFFRSVGLVVSVSFGLWLVSIGIPALILLPIHLRPRKWKRQDYILFLRAFRGTSNTAALGPLARGTPRGVRVAFLAPPTQQSSSWDPITLGLAGFSLLRPLTSAPVYLRSDIGPWEEDVRALASDAAAVVIDISDATDSVLIEVEILKDLQPHPRTLCLIQNQSPPTIDSRTEILMQEAVPEPGRLTIIYYDRSGLAGLVRRLLVAAVLSVLATPFVALLIVAITPDTTDVDTSIAVAAGVSVVLAIPFALATSARHGYSRRSAAEIRAAVRTAFGPKPSARHVLSAWREHLRVVIALGIPVVAWFGLSTWWQIGSDLDLLRKEAVYRNDPKSTGPVLDAHSRLSRIPLLRSRIDRLLAAHLAGRSESENGIEAKLAYGLKSLAFGPNPKLRQTLISLLEKPLPRALAMTYGSMALVHNLSVNRGASLLVVGGTKSLNFTEYEPIARAWDVQSGRPASQTFLLPKVRNEKDYYANAAAVEAALSPDGSYLVMADTSKVFVAALDGSYTKELPGTDLKRIAVSPDSSRFVTGNATGASHSQIRIFDRFGNRPSEVLLPKLGYVNDFQFGRSPNRLLVVTGGAIAWINVPEGGPLALHRNAANETVQTATMGDGRIVIVSTVEKDQTTIERDQFTFEEDETTISKIQLLSADDLRAIGSPIAQKGRIEAIAVSPDGTLIAWSAITCCRLGPQFSRLEVWGARDQTRVCSVSTEDDPATSIAFSPDSRHLAVAGVLELSERSPRDCEQIGSPIEMKAKFVAYTPDGQNLLTCDSGTPRLWRAASVEGAKSPVPVNDPARALEMWLRMTALKFDYRGELIRRFDAQ